MILLADGLLKIASLKHIIHQFNARRALLLYFSFSFLEAFHLFFRIVIFADFELAL